MGSRNTYRLVLTCGFALGWSCLTQPLHADEIVTLFDQHGHKVYVNTGDPAKGSNAWRNQGFRSSGSTTYATAPLEVVRLVEQTANRFNIDPHLVHAIIQVESEYNPNALSRRGAMGLMQLIPATAQRFGVKNAFDPRQNLEGGVNYLKHLLEMFGGNLPLSLAAYNAGENSVIRYRGVPAISETRSYVRRVTGLYGSDFTAVEGRMRRYPVRRYVDAEGAVHFSNVD